MLIAGIVAVVAILLVLYHRISLFRRSKVRLPVWLNIAQIRTAREAGWSGISDELDGLLHQQFRERMQKKEAFWAAVSGAERGRRDRGA